MIIRCSAIPPEVYGQAAEPILRRPDLPNTRRRPEADLLRPGGTERQVLGVCSRGLPGWWPSPGRFGPGSRGAWRVEPGQIRLVSPGYSGGLVIFGRLCC